MAELVWGRANSPPSLGWSPGCAALLDCWCPCRTLGLGTAASGSPGDPALLTCISGSERPLQLVPWLADVRPPSPPEGCSAHQVPGHDLSWEVAPSWEPAHPWAPQPGHHPSCTAYCPEVGRLKRVWWTLSAVGGPARHQSVCVARAQVWSKLNKAGKYPEFTQLSPALLLSPADSVSAEDARRTVSGAVGVWGAGA